MRLLVGVMLAGALLAVIAPDANAASRRGKNSHGHSRSHGSSRPTAYIHGNERFYPVAALAGRNASPAANFFAYLRLGR